MDPRLLPNECMVLAVLKDTEHDKDTLGKLVLVQALFTLVAYIFNAIGCCGNQSSPTTCSLPDLLFQKK